MKKKIITLAASAFIAGSALAQKSATQFLSDMQTDADTLGSKALDVIAIVIGIGGGVLLIPNFIKMLRNDPQAQDAFVKWFVVIVISIAAIELLKAFFF